MGSELQVKYQNLAQEYAKVFYIYFSDVLKFAQLWRRLEWRLKRMIFFNWIYRSCVRKWMCSRRQ